jgi:hypothetical protein
MADQSLSLNSPLLAHPEEARLVAAVIAQWNASEHLLGAIFALLVGTDPWHAAAILGALASPAAKIDLVESAGRYTLENSPRLEQLEKLAKSSRSVMRTRHTLAHGIYGVSVLTRVLRHIREVSEREWELDRPGTCIAEKVSCTWAQLNGAAAWACQQHCLRL